MKLNESLIFNLAYWGIYIPVVIILWKKAGFFEDATFFSIFAVGFLASSLYILVKLFYSKKKAIQEPEKDASKAVKEPEASFRELFSEGGAQ